MYQALYRKWRPMSFDDVVSQPHITTTLKNQIKTGKTAHAYLFTGSRGTGKTTCARIFAKAVNCENPHDGEPCLDCKICKAADNGTLADIIEIDAASNSRVDDIRELREGVVYTPEMSKYKVYIIDEVHMLSAGAFNALLKTMEEPPEHVKFILATTEIHKVPATIVSRCQHFDFHRIRTEDIVDRLTFIAQQEGFTLEKDAAAMIARLSDGGMRDALSLLDQCVAFDDHITLDVVSGASGIAGRDYLFDMIEHIADKDAAEALKIVDKLYSMSKDLKVLANELLVQMRNVMLVKTVDNSRELVICLPDEYERLKALANKLRLDEILKSITVLQECNERFAKCTSKRIEMEMTIIRLCSASGAASPAAEGNVQAAAPAEVSGLMKRIASLESRLAGGAAAVQPNAAARPAEPPKQYDPELKQLNENNDGPLKQWNDIVSMIRDRSPAVGTFLKGSVAFIKGSDLFLIVQSDIYLKKFKSSSDASIINEVLLENYGKTFNIKVKSAKKAAPDDADDPTNQLLDKAKASGIEVEIKN
ncbi:MAG: DNA polymerase III subunit gamma/tau [Ruminococcus sp.]|nr:DNA polymerase III subunit gamma/tau [Ruminococcus sp.]